MSSWYFRIIIILGLSLLSGGLAERAGPERDPAIARPDAGEAVPGVERERKLRTRDLQGPPPDCPPFCIEPPPKEGGGG